MYFEFQVIKFANIKFRKLIQYAPFILLFFLLITVICKTYFLIGGIFLGMILCGIFENYSKRYVRVGNLNFNNGDFIYNGAVQHQNEIIKIKICINEIKGDSFLSSRLPVELISNGADNYVEIKDKKGKTKYCVLCENKSDVVNLKEMAKYMTEKGISVRISGLKNNSLTGSGADCPCKTKKTKQ